MSKPSVLLIGAGGHAKACIEVIESQQNFQIFGLIGDKDEVGRKILGHEVVGSDSDLPSISKFCINALVTVGQIGHYGARRRLFQRLTELGFNIPIMTGATAVVSAHAKVGAGTVIMHQAIINAGAVIGVNCIINSGSIIEHDVVVGDHCHISTGVIINGNASIGTGTFLGSGSLVREGVIIGEDVIVGMGCKVRKAIGDHELYTGG